MGRPSKPVSWINGRHEQEGTGSGKVEQSGTVKDHDAAAAPSAPSRRQAPLVDVSLSTFGGAVTYPCRRQRPRGAA